jgi:hypothetical protein
MWILSMCGKNLAAPIVTGIAAEFHAQREVPLRKTEFQTQHTAAQKQWAAGISGGNFNGTACFGSAETRGAK